MPTDHTTTGGDDANAAAMGADAADFDNGRDSERGGAVTELDSILEQYSDGGGGYRVQLYRIDSVDGESYVGTLPLTGNLVAIVQERYGGGRFGGKIVDNRSKYVRRMPQFRIAGEPRDPKAAAATPPVTALDAAGIAQTIATTIAATLGGFRESIVDAIRAAQPAPAAAVDPLAMVTQVATLIQTLQPKNSSDTVGMMRDLMELQREMRGGGSDSDAGNGGGVAEVMREFAPLVKDALTNREPASAPVLNPAPRPITETKPVAAWLRPYMQYRGALLSFADQGKNPAQYAGLIADNVTDEQATLIAQAQAANQLERDLFDAIPQLHHSEQRRRFAGGLLKTLVAELFGEPKMRRSSKRKRASKRAAKSTGAANGE